MHTLMQKMEKLPEMTWKPCCLHHILYNRITLCSKPISLILLSKHGLCAEPTPSLASEPSECERGSGPSHLLQRSPLLCAKGGPVR